MRSVTLALAFTVLPLAAFATITPDASQSQVSYTVDASVGSLSDTEYRSDIDSNNASEDGVRIFKSDGTDFLDVDLDAYLTNQTGGDGYLETYLRLYGSGRIEAALNGAGSSNGSIDVDATFTANPDFNESTYQFTLDETEAITLDITLDSTVGEVEVAFQILDGSDWNDLTSATATTEGITLSTWTSSLAPGTYRIISRMGLSLEFGEPAAKVSYNFAIYLGDVPEERLPVPEGEYTHPAVGHTLKNSSKLSPILPTIQSEIDLGDGFTDVTIAAGLANSSLCPWADLVLSLRTKLPSGPDLTLSDPTIEFPTLDAQATADAPTGDTIVARVPNDQLPAFRDSITDGTRFTTSGRELLVFRYPVLVLGYDDIGRPIEPGTQRFENIGDLAVDHLIIEFPEFFEEPLTVVTDPLPYIEQGYDAQLPYFINNITYSHTENYYVASGEQVSIADYLLHGTFTETITPSHHPHDFAVTEGKEVTGQNLSPVAIPLHINSISIDDLIEVSGSFAFVPKGFDVETTFENGLPKDFIVSATFRADVNILLETKGATDNTPKTISQKQKTVYQAPLFTINLANGLRFSPELTISVGAEVNAPTSLTVPLNSNLEITLRAGVVDGEPYYDQASTLVPVQISDPNFFQDLAAQARAFVNAELFLAITDPSGTVTTGPTVGARASSQFTLAPLVDPYWNTSGKLELRGGIELKLFNFFDVVDEEKTFKTYPLFSRDAGRPIVDLSPSAQTIKPSALDLQQFATTENTRWARILDHGHPGPLTAQQSFAIPLANSHDILVGGASSAKSTLARYAPDGTLVSLQTAGFLGLVPIEAVPEPDGGYTLLSGSNGSVQLTRFDATGALLWTSAHRIDSVAIFQPIDLLRDTDSQGAARYFVLGSAATLSPTAYFPVIVALDATGAPIWQKSYPVDSPAGENTDVTTTEFLLNSQNEIVFAGTTNADIQPSPYKGSESNAFILNLLPNGLVAKVSPEDGSVITATLLPQYINPTYAAIAEDPDGNLYIGGRLNRSLLDDAASLFITKLTADLTPIDSVLIGHAGSRFAAGQGGYDPYLSDLPHDGETLYDIIYDMQWIDGALWICGQLGIFNSSALPIADGSAAFTARIETDLNVTRFALHGGTSLDSLHNLADGGPDGLIAFGVSASHLPWPNGATGEADVTPNALLTYKLPWEGLLRYHPLTPAASQTLPNVGSHYIYPRVQSGSSHGTFALYQSRDSGETDQTPIRSATTTLLATDLVLSPTTSYTALADSEPLSHHAIEYVPETVVTDRQTYFAWRQIPDDDALDSDSDNYSNSLEFFLGTDPFTPTLDSLLAIDPLPGDPANNFQISFPRAKLAADQEPLIEFSLNLLDWDPLTGYTLESSELNATQDLLTAPIYIEPTPEQIFYRLNLTPTPLPAATK